ncbi:MAG: excalibur calcium-binding domain-containing protein [Methylobacter sp.]|uniref:excalibur calcium-binding domain-containing protein n=1 Tax=Methylobacter sp. TaxID=2051955 RepID=UPI002730331F|nr:excalibur calcium-binding domain-containing protein [Methylobacter sp.]MDP1663571.1 excalibur calcium-binding domain-containing protein [Methylobacter sp.]
MNRIIVILVVLGLGWYGNQKYRTHQQELLSDTSETTTEYVASSEPDVPSNSSQFKCDGRTHCSQMTSCEEATFFINNCLGTKMDGNNDGIPCERQWCQ